jgi:hypothetical protein
MLRSSVIQADGPPSGDAAPAVIFNPTATSCRIGMSGYVSVNKNYLAKFIKLVVTTRQHSDRSPIIGASPLRRMTEAQAYRARYIPSAN